MPFVVGSRSSCSRRESYFLATHLSGQVQFITPDSLAPPAVVSYAFSPVPSNNLNAAVFPSVSGQSSESGPAPLIEPAHLAFLATPESFDGPIAAESATSVAFAGPRLLSAVAGETSHEVAGPAPFRAIERGEGLSQVTDAAITDSVLDYSGPIMSPDYAVQNGFGPGGPGLVLISAPNPGGGPGAFVQGESFRETFGGTLDQAHPLYSLELTINSPTESMAFSLHPIDVGGMMPAFGAMRMYSPDGSPFAELDPELGPGGAPPQMVNFSMRSAPVGGRVVVQIVPSESSTASAAGTTEVAAPAAADWSVPFVLNVQRQDDESLAASSALPAQGSLAVGTLTISASGPSALPSSPEADGHGARNASH